MQLSWQGNAYDPSLVSSIDSAGYRLLATIASDKGWTPMAPGLVTATTYSRSMTAFATEIYRFLPLDGILCEAHRDHGPLKRSRHWR